MELRDYFKIIGRHIWIVLVIVIVAVVSAYFFNRGKAMTYTASNTFTVNKSSTLKQEQTPYYLYDNFYNVQSADLFAQIVAKWFVSPSFTESVYQEAGIPSRDLSQKALGDTFLAAYQVPATVNVSVTGENKDNVTKLMTAAAKVAQEKTDELGQGQSSYYTITNFAPVVSENKPKLKTDLLIGLISGVILGILAALAIFYFKKEKID